jgi:RecA/RadA recombinase
VAAETGWGDDFARLVLACALRGELLTKLPGALQPGLFGGGGAPSPRQRIATVVSEYWTKYGTRVPSVDLQEAVRQAAARLGAAERDALERELARVLATEAPRETGFITDQVREQAELRTMEQGILEAAAVLAAGPSAVGTAREILAKASAPLVPADARVRTISYLKDANVRLGKWRAGEEQGERISTGFSALDYAMRGGPTRREVHYFIAPPKGGKTAALLHVVAAASRRRYGVYVATYEMQAMRMALRMDRKFARSTSGELALDTKNLERALVGLGRSGAGEVVIDECLPQQPESVAAAARRVEQIRREGGRVDLVVLDYLNIMGASREEREKRHELAKVSREIASLAKELDVLVWTAALVNRAAVNKQIIRKTDIAEVFEVVAVADGMVAICATRDMVRDGYRRFYVAAAREEADEVRAGTYRVDFSKMTFDPVDEAGEGEVDALLAAERDRTK